MTRVRLCWLVFVALVVFVAVAVPRDLSRFVLPLFLLGVALIALASTSPLKPWQRFFFILTGAGAAGFQAGLWLQRLLAGPFPGEGFSFVLVFIVSPITLAVGVLGALVTGLASLFPRR